MVSVYHNCRRPAGVSHAAVVMFAITAVAGVWQTAASASRRAVSTVHPTISILPRFMEMFCMGWTRVRLAQSAEFTLVRIAT